jgi:hypothetical protein
MVTYVIATIRPRIEANPQKTRQGSIPTVNREPEANLIGFRGLELDFEGVGIWKPEIAGESAPDVRIARGEDRQRVGAVLPPDDSDPLRRDQ